MGMDVTYHPIDPAWAEDDRALEDYGWTGGSPD